MTTGLPRSVSGDLGVASGDDYQSRLQRAAYRPPSGESIEFDYEEVRRSTELRGSAYTFPGVDEHFVQRTGFGSRVYPLRCYFWGPQHDLVATAFEAACLEPGQGTLTHPLYGTFKVTPFGTLARRNDLVRAANESIVDVTFWTSLPSAYPGVESDRRNEVLVAVTDFDLKAARQFAEGTALAGVIEQASLLDTIETFLDRVDDTLGAVAAATNAARAEFDDKLSLLQRGMGTLIGQPLLLAQNVLELLKAPGRALAGLRSQMDAYRSLARSLSGSRQGAETVRLALRESALTGLSSSRRNLSVNNVRSVELFGMGAMSGAVVSAMGRAPSVDAGPATTGGAARRQGDNTQASRTAAGIATRPQAQAAAASLLAQFEELTSWRDDALQGVGATDSGEAGQALHRAVTLAAGHLSELGDTLLAERVVVLDRPRTIVDLAAELFGSVDDRLDALIQYNDLTGSEILELPAGASVAYLHGGE